MKEIEKRIKASFAEEKPDVRDRIMASCENEKVLERVEFSRHERTKSTFSWRYCAVAASLLVTFLVGLVSGSFIFGRTTDGTEDQGSLNGDTDGASSSELASVYIDVNPSIEIKVDLSGRIAECTSANDDAEAIIDGMNLVGVEIKTALNALIGSMYMKGYLADSANSMLISMQGDKTKFDTLLTTIVNDANDILAKANISCSIIAQDCSKNEQIGDLANKNHVSVGKMTLIEKIIAADEEYTDDDASELAKLAIKDLNRLDASFFDEDGSKPEEDGDGDGTHGDPSKPKPDGDIIFGVLEEQAEDALELASDYLSEKLSADIEEDALNVIAVIPKNLKLGKFNYKLIYSVTVLYGTEIYVLEVDCDEKSVTDITDFDKNEEPPSETDRDKEWGDRGDKDWFK